MPVYLSNEDYQGKSPAVAPEEVKAWERIYREALQEKRPAGSVCVYLVAPDGNGIASLIVSDACKPGALLNLLKDTAAKLGTTPGKPLVPLAKHSGPPRSEADSLVLHLVSRYDRRGSWAEFPAENWLVLSREEWMKFLPPDDVGSPGSWRIDATVSGELLTCFFPQTEICTFCKLSEPDGPYKHRLEEHELTARQVSRDKDTARIRLDGKLRLRHKFYPNHEDENRAVASVVGYMDMDMSGRKITRFRLVTSEAVYAKWPFTVAVRERE